MTKDETDKLLAELEAQQAALDAEFEALGLSDYDEAEPFKGYPEIVRVAYEASDAELVPELQRLIAEGTDVNAASPYGETALVQCFQRSAFEAMRLLIRAGADTSYFEWSAHDEAIAMGEVPELQAGDPALIARNGGGRSLFLQACRFDNLDAAQVLEPITPEEAKTVVPDGEGPVMMAAEAGSIPMLEWLLARGYDVNARDHYGGTALVDAAEQDFVDVARWLLAHGADASLGRNISRQMADSQPETDGLAGMAQRIMAKTSDMMAGMMDMPDTISAPASVARSPEMVALLAESGVPLSDFDSDDIPALIGANRIPETQITPEMFHAQYAPRAGVTNPERVDIPLWREQIRTGRSGYGALRDILGERPGCGMEEPVWSFDRFGRTGTRLPDGRWVLVAGEHEDHYDPDFCIYADVTVIHPDATVEHFIYPEDVFPPTDFHTATLLGDHILLIGNLGYQGKRREGETQVLRLNLSDFSIGRVETSGQNPGWINRHEAVHSDGVIMISGGHVEPGYQANSDVFALNLATKVWSRVQ